MEKESILDSIEEEVSYEDVEMMDIEEGEVVDNHNPQPSSNNTNTNTTNNNKSKKKKKKNKKRKKKKSEAVAQSNGIDIDRFVQNVCKRLRERKSYLVYTAVGVLGVSALSDLLNEVDAVQACGGQKTALGDRNRTSGGILWNLLKARDPHAYKEIMKKGKDFEKQFRRPNHIVQQPGATTSKPEDATSDDDFAIESPLLVDSAQPSIKEKRGPVHDRIRVPVSYDDLPGEEPPTDLP